MPSSTKSYLEQQGFRQLRSCNCGGMRETWMRFGKPAIYVDVRLARDSFRVTSVYPPVRGSLSEMPSKLGALLKDLGYA